MWKFRGKVIRKLDEITVFYAVEDEFREMEEGNRFSWLTPWFTFDLSHEKGFVPLEIFKKLNFCYNLKKEEITHPHLSQKYLSHL